MNTSSVSTNSTESDFEDSPLKALSPLFIPYEEMKILEPVGRGGFGYVYKAEYLGRTVAIKEMYVNNYSTSSFEKEAAILASVKHEQIVELYGLCVSERCQAIVMEYMANGNLTNFLSTQPHANWRVIYQIGLDIAAGLEYLHSRKIVHCDIKSDNILLATVEGRIRGKVADFGISQFMSERSTFGDNNQNGTPCYMAPELWEDGAKNTMEADLYSLGLVLCQLGTRHKKPFQNIEGIFNIIQAAKQGVRDQISADTPPVMAAWIQRCWAADPLERPKISEVVNALAQEFERDFSYDVDQPESPEAVYSFCVCYQACQKGNFEFFDRWFQKTPEILADKGCRGETFLYAAVESNQLEKLKWMHRQNPSLLNVCRDDGSTLMHVAADLGHKEILQWLYRQDSSLLKQTNKEGWMPLYLAAFKGHVSILRSFLAYLEDNLVFAAAAKPSCQESLAFFLEHGFNPITRIHQTLLHKAAQAGQKENVQYLLSQNADINCLDLSGRTPLFLAAVEGHIGTVKLLIENGARIDCASVEGETILHVAAGYGHGLLLAELLPLFKDVDLKDADGKTPLHKAVWLNSKPHIVKKLIDAGADVNAKNNYGYRPLHWAAKHGHVESAELLIGHGAELSCINDNLEMPLDLAIKFGQDETVHLFLGIREKMSNGPLPPQEQLEDHYKTLLKQAMAEDKLEQQIFYMEKVSDFYVEKEQFVKAAKLLNGALSLLKKNPHYKKHLLSKLERIEGLFLHFEGIKVSVDQRHYIAHYRKNLQIIRKECRKALKNGNPAEHFLAKTTKDITNLLRNVISKTLLFLGPSPCKWSMLGLDLFSNETLSPFSEIELALVIETDNEQSKHYFRKLSGLLELQIINLGRSSYFSFLEEELNRSQNVSGNEKEVFNQSECKAIVGFAGTVQQLAGLQGLAAIKSNFSATWALRNTALIAGDKNLFAQYEKAKEKVLKEKSQETKKEKAVDNQEHFLRRLKANYPILGQQEEGVVAVEKEFYKPFHHILSILAYHYNLSAKTDHGRIEELRKKKIISPEGANSLKLALHRILSLQLEANFFYRENIDLLHVEIKGRGLKLTPQHLKCLQEINRTLSPFHRVIKDFLMRAESKKFLLSQLFYD